MICRYCGTNFEAEREMFSLDKLFTGHNCKEALSLTLEDKVQLILLDFEETLLKERMPCGFYKCQTWSPNDWSARILQAVAEGKE